MRHALERVVIITLLSLALFGSSIPLLGAAGPLLSVQTLGTGGGTLSSSPAGIACGTDCSESYPIGGRVSLSATAAAGSSVAAWGGACAGVLPTRACSLTMDASKTAQATFQPSDDITITLAGNPNPVAVGQVLTYTLTVNNRGPNASNSVDVVHTLPVGVSLQTATPSQGTCQAGTTVPVAVTCALGGLANGGHATIRVGVIASGTRTLTSVAHVSSTDTFDTNIRNNWSSGATIVGTVPADPVVVAAGDIACDPSEISFMHGVGNTKVGSPGYCQQKFTAELLPGLHPTVLLPLGDLQYVDGRLDAFQHGYGPSWGFVFKSITHPAVGNHEYNTPDAAGYFDYFGAAAGTRGEGYYSFDVGTWHLIALNSNCAPAGGCGAGSPQERWLRADLAAHPSVCTLAYWHHPLFKSGVTESTAGTVPLWNALYQAGADLILNGHEHMYERFAAQDPTGAADPARGLREFIVGTGGRNHGTFPSVAAHSEVRNADTFGVMKLVLHPASYDWEFVPEAGSTFTDSGTTACH